MTEAKCHNLVCSDETAVFESLLLSGVRLQWFIVYKTGVAKVVSIVRQNRQVIKEKIVSSKFTSLD